MKKCPRCQKNIPGDAKICPYCGTPQPGYGPAHHVQKSRRSMVIYYIIIIILLNIPFVLSYMFTYDELTSDEIISNEQITLGPYTESGQEIVEYQYDTLESFSQNVTNSEDYVEKIQNVENQLEELLPNEKFSKEYLFEITQNNNLYAFVSYEITTSENEVYNIDYAYNLAGDTSCRIDVINENLGSVDEIYALTSEKQEVLNSVITLLNGKDNEKLLNETQEKFISIKDELNDNISHYGKGISKTSSNQKSMIRVFENDGKYRVKRSFETTLNRKNFI